MTADGKNVVIRGHAGWDGEEMSEEEIDSTLMDSFPAGDPPSWTLGTNSPEDRPRESEAGETLVYP